MNIKTTYNNYFKRQLQLIGKQKLLKLKNSKILVVGAGGLGSNVSHQLANNGVGTVGIMDGDVVSLSNLHRQKNYCIHDINRKKTTALTASITKNNPYVKIIDYPFYLSDDIQTSLFNKYHIIVDCTDNQDTKFLINDLCIYYHKPLIFGAVQKNEGQISVLNFNNGPSLRCAFPKNSQHTNISCEELGTMDIVTSTVASKQVVECLNIITENQSKLNGKLLHIDVFNHKTHIFKINKTSSYHTFKPSNNPTKKKLISAKDFNSNLQIKKHLFIDLRSTKETPRIEHVNLKNIAIDDLKTQIRNESLDKEIIVFCQSGIRSSKALQILTELGYKNVVHLEGGVNALEKNNL